MRVCSTTHVYHALLNAEFETIDPILKNGLRPLSDFPESARWQELEKMMPGFYQNLYDSIAKPVLNKPYTNSGIFVTPIDFQKALNPLMSNKTRICIPVTRLDPEFSVITYVLDEQRTTLPLTAENMEKTAQLWDNDMVQTWFAKDRSKMFFYVPQIAVYQPQGIPVTAADIEDLNL